MLCNDLRPRITSLFCRLSSFDFRSTINNWRADNFLSWIVALALMTMSRLENGQSARELTRMKWNGLRQMSFMTVSFSSQNSFDKHMQRKTTLTSSVFIFLWNCRFGNAEKRKVSRQPLLQSFSRLLPSSFFCWPNRNSNLIQLKNSPLGNRKRQLPVKWMRSSFGLDKNHE